MKKRYLAAGIVLAVLVLAGLWILPLLRAAGTLQRIAGGKSFTYQIEAALDSNGLSEEQNQFLTALSWLFGTDEKSCLTWQAAGKITDKCGYARLYSKGIEEPVTEVYFTQDQKVVNIKMLYEILQKNFGEEYPLLESILPKWEYAPYISMDQMEEIFETDLESMFQQSSFQFSKMSAWQILMMLAKSEKTKGENGIQQFKTVWNGYQVVLEIGKKEGKPRINLQGMDSGGGKVLAAFQAEISAEKEEKVVFPDFLMKQEEVAQFQNLWSAIKQMKEGASNWFH